MRAVAHRGARDRPPRRPSSGSRLGIVVAGRCAALFKPSAFDLPSTAPCSRRGRSSSRSCVGTSSRCRRARARRCAPRACRRWRRCARAPSRRRRVARLTPLVALSSPSAWLALMLSGLFGVGDGDAPPELVGGGAVRVFIGVACSLATSSGRSPRGRQAARAASRHHRPARARERRAQPGRTASTAAALMIGVTLVTFVAIFAAGEGDDRRCGRRRPSGRAVAQTTNFSPCRRRGGALPAVDGVERVSGTRFTKADRRRRGQHGGHRRRPADVRRRLRCRTGSTAPPRRCARSEPGEVLLVEEDGPRTRDLRGGDTLDVTTPTARDWRRRSARHRRRRGEPGRRTRPSRTRRCSRRPSTSRDDAFVLADDAGAPASTSTGRRNAPTESMRAALPERRGGSPRRSPRDDQEDESSAAHLSTCCCAHAADPLFGSSTRSS